MQVAGGRVDEIEDDAVGVDETAGLGHDIAQDVARFAQDGDPRRDLAQRLLGARASRQGLLRLTEGIDQARRPDRDGSLVGDRPEQARVPLGPSIGPATRHEQRPERTGLVDERDGHDRPDPDTLDVVVDGTQVREPRVRDVVAGPERTAGDDGLTGDALVERLRLAHGGDERLLGGKRARRVRSAQLSDGRVDEVDPRAFGVHQAGRLLDAQLENGRQVGGRTDPGRDLPQRPLDVGPGRDLVAGRVERLDEPGVGHRRRRVVGEGLHQADVGLAEGVVARRERSERSEHLVGGDERRDDHRTDPDVTDHPIGVLGVSEGLVGEIVAGQDDRTHLDSAPEHPHADGQVDRAHPVAAALAPDPGVVREAEMPGGRIDEVDHRPVGLEQAGRLVDGRDEQVVDVAPSAIRVECGAGPGGARCRLGPVRLVILVRVAVRRRGG